MDMDTYSIEYTFYNYTLATRQRRLGKTKLTRLLRLKCGLKWVYRQFWLSIDFCTMSISDILTFRLRFRLRLTNFIVQVSEFHGVCRSWRISGSDRLNSVILFQPTFDIHVSKMTIVCFRQVIREHNYRSAKINEKHDINKVLETLTVMEYNVGHFDFSYRPPSLSHWQTIRIVHRAAIKFVKLSKLSTNATIKLDASSLRVINISVMLFMFQGGHMCLTP